MMIKLQIDVTPDEWEQLQQSAQAEGFESAEAYIKWLALQPTKAELLADIQQGIIAIERGDTFPTLDDMWVELENRDETSG